MADRESVPKRSGSAFLWDFLKSQGVQALFGYPGGAVIPIYDEYARDDRGIRHIRTSHEQGAVHAADGYARSTGKTGVAIVTSGPGATNAVTGIATAYMDSVPMVVVCGQVPTALLGKDSFQEIDITGITMSITKYNVLVRSAEDLPIALNDAFRIAQEGRPGPVLVDIPKDILMGLSQYPTFEKHQEACVEVNADSKVGFKADGNVDVDEDVDVEIDIEDWLSQTLGLLEKSKRPIIYAGGGVKIAEASKHLMTLAEKNDIPVISTLMGLGTIPGNHGLNLGLAGMHGSIKANEAVRRSDLMIALGVRFSDRIIGKVASFAPEAAVVHLDIDKCEFGKNVASHLSVTGCLNENLKALSSAATQKTRTEWRDEIACIDAFKSHSDALPVDAFNPKNILKKLSRAHRGAIVSTDVGQHQMWTAQHWEFMNPRDFLTSGGLGTMGFGMGAAIGAQVGNPDKTVVLVTGDGSFRMNMNELPTLIENGLPINVFILHNGALGMVRQWQKLFHEERYSVTTVQDTIRYEGLANAFGMHYHEVENMVQLQDAMDLQASSGGSSLTVIRLSEDEGVYPIIPPGCSLDKVIERG